MTQLFIKTFQFIESKANLSKITERAQIGHIASLLAPVFSIYMYNTYNIIIIYKAVGSGEGGWGGSSPPSPQ